MSEEAKGGQRETCPWKDMATMSDEAHALRSRANAGQVFRRADKTGWPRVIRQPIAAGSVVPDAHGDVPCGLSFHLDQRPDDPERSHDPANPDPARDPRPRL